MGSLQPAGAMSAPTTAFLVQATLWIVGLFALLRLRWVADYVLGGLIDFQMTVLSWQGTALGARLVVAPSCGGADVSARCLGVTLAYPVTWPRRVLRRRGHSPRADRQPVCAGSVTYVSG